ncbi:MAG: hypothetical protein KKA07_09610 [Bacteroidetes bacterium]|nr:hypothetical protein [Bacteroidota bacterium]MBU1719317.1 hypothetical protein [Bacteroidota bacterium]
MRKILLTAVTLLVAAGLFAQKAQKVELRLSLKDGNIVTGTSKISNIQLATDYGKLDIPIVNITAIKLGVKPDIASKDKIVGLLKQLNTEDEKVRSSVYEQIVALGQGAVPIISDFLYSDKYEPGLFMDFTPESALQELMSVHGIADDYSLKDVITIDYEYVMGGSFDFKAIDLVTEYGNLTIPREKINEIEVLVTGGATGDRTFKLMATKHISSNQNGGWLKTGINMKAGQKFSISATGEIVFASLSNAAYTPSGAKGAAATNDYGDDYLDGGASGTYPTYGNVVYKIGESGVVMKAGAKFTGTATSSGMLYLSIYETVYNPANTGSYTVKVK